MITAAQVDAEHELAAVCGVLNASFARLVAIVDQTLKDDTWAIAGVRSPEHWLAMRAGLSPFHARQVVAVVRRCGDLPTVMGQFAAGQLSLDQVSVVARYAPAHVEASVAEFAVNASVTQLRRALSKYSFDPPTQPGVSPQTTTFDTEPDDAEASNEGPDDTEACDGETGDMEAGDMEAGDKEAGDKEAGDKEASDKEASDNEASDNEASDNEADDKEAGDGDREACDSEACDSEACDSEASHGEAGDAETCNPPTWNGFALDDGATAPAELSISHDENGRFTLRFTAPADVGALVEAALKEAKDALFRAGHPKATMGDAMVELARRSLGSVTSINRRDAYRTYVHLDSEGGWLTGKPRLPAQITRKLTCDGILQPVWHTQGAPVNVGRAQRIVPTRTRRLVEDRDRGCRFPGCPSTHVECHHVIHWVDGGPTDTWNLAGICPFHHDAHHDGDFIIAGNADDPGGLTFTTRHGYPIRPGPTFTTPINPPPPTATPDPPGSSSPAVDPPQILYRGPTGESLDLGWITFSEPRELEYFDEPQEPVAFEETLDSAFF